MEELLEGVQHGLTVGAGPVDFVTLRTRLEVGLRLENESGNLFAHSLSRNFHQKIVAGEAARQDARQAGGMGDIENLLELRLDVLTFEEDKILHRLSHQQTRVAG